MLRKLVDTLSRHGMLGLVFRAQVALADWWFDLRYGVNTRGITPLDGLRISGQNRSGGHRYEPARVLPIRTLFHDLKPELPQPSALVDFGSGKGRILLIAAECGFARATGVEFAFDLCAVARSNCNTFRTITHTSTELTVVESDAVDYAVGERDNIFFFFNPFSDSVTTRVLDNIVGSLKSRPRRVVLAFYNTDPAGFIGRYAMFSNWRDVDYRGYRIRLFTNRG